jgi:hypothetical protein
MPAAHNGAFNKEQIMVRSLCLVSALLLASTAAWAQNDQSRPGNFAQDRANTVEGRACRGDAHRFCKDEIPDEFRVASCLQEHRDKISHACRAVLEGNGR